MLTSCPVVTEDDEPFERNIRVRMFLVVIVRVVNLLSACFVPV